MIWLPFLALLWTVSPAAAQNTTCATRAITDNSNACASTAYVSNHTAMPPIDNTGTDDVSAGLTSWFASHSYAQLIPGTYRCASTCIIPDGAILEGQSFNATTTGTFGVTFICDLAVSPCVQLGDGASHESGMLARIKVTRAAGSVPALSKGVYIYGGASVALEDVLSDRHAYGYYLKANGEYGITAAFTRVYTSSITDVHVVQDSWPELRISQARFGARGLLDPACNAFIRETGETTGPNTLYVENSQFNLGSGEVCGTVLDFKSFGASGQGGIISEYSIIGSHVEAATNIVQTDSSVTLLSRLALIGNQFLDNAGTAEFWDLHANTQLGDVRINSNAINYNTFTLPGANQYNNVVINDNTFGISAVSITGYSNSTVIAEGNVYGDGLTLAGDFLRARFTGTFSGGTLTSTVTPGNVELDFPGLGVTACPATFGVAFGGATTGITYGTRTCRWQVRGGQMVVDYTLILTSKGSATGSATLINLPVNASGSGVFGGAYIPYSANMSGLAGAIVISPNSSAATASIYEQAATGVSALNDTHFTNTSILAGTLVYSISP